MQPFLKNALLNTRELKNALVCSGEHSMCFPSYYRPPPNNALGEEVDFFFKFYSNNVKFSWAFACSQDHSTIDLAFCIPPPISLMLKGIFNVPLIILQTFLRCHVGS